MSDIELVTADGHNLAAYERHPIGATSAIVVVQEIFGVNAHIRSLVDRFAGLGFHAIAPAIFDRLQRNVQFGYDADSVSKGREIKSALDWESAVADIRAAVEQVSTTGRVGVVGYCLGGSLAWLSAVRLPIAAAVGYYGAQIIDHLDRPPIAPVMLHFGASDPAIPLEDVRTISARWPEVEVHVYDSAGHGFNCDARSAYDAAAAAMALERTLRFLDRHGVTGTTTD